MKERANDWMAQAERDLGMAHSALREGRHEWACFAAQQAAAMAVKACHLLAGDERRFRSVSQAIGGLHPPAPLALIGKAGALDRHYFATRYPNAHLAGAPFQHYAAADSERAIEDARQILAFAKGQVALGGGD